jgi:hypothetical protein
MMSWPNDIRRSAATFMAQDHEESSPSPGKFGQPGMKRAVISTKASVAKHPRTANLAPLYPASA